MKTVQVISVEGEQAIKFPPDFRVSSETLTIRKDGDAIILEPIKSTTWPEDFFEGIYVEDPAFARPPQGAMPPAPSLP